MPNEGALLSKSLKQSEPSIPDARALLGNGRVLSHSIHQCITTIGSIFYLFCIWSASSQVDLWYEIEFVFICTTYSTGWVN